MNYEVGKAPDQTAELSRRHGGRLINIPVYEPTVIMSTAIEEIQRLGNYKVLVAIVNETDDSEVEVQDRLYTYTDIESAKLRHVIYKRIEQEVE